MPSHTRRISTACLIGLASLTGACADANLTGPNIPGQPAYSVTAAAATAWTASGPGVTVVSDGTAGDAVMSYYAPGGFGNWTFTTTATQTGTVTLPWSYSGSTSGGGPTQVNAVVNNVVVASLGSTGFDPFSLNGTFTFNVNAGDTYGFQFTSISAFAEPVSGTFTVQVPQQQDPTTKDDCKDGEWVEYGFSNQGRCITFVNTGDDSR